MFLWVKNINIEVIISLMDVCGPQKSRVDHTISFSNDRSISLSNEVLIIIVFINKKTQNFSNKEN